MPYGYLGQNQPNQTVNNSGVFSITDVAELQSQGKLGGSLELIEEQTASSDSAIEFLSIQENKFDVHYLSIFLTEATGNVDLQLSNNGGTSYHTTGYQYAEQYGSVGGTFADAKGTSLGYMMTLGGGGTGLSKNAYSYLYNLGNSNKYSFQTFHFFGEHPTLSNYFKFGGGVYPTAETHNAIRLFMSSGTMTGTIKLYGVKQI